MISFFPLPYPVIHTGECIRRRAVVSDVKWSLTRESEKLEYFYFLFGSTAVKNVDPQYLPDKCCDKIKSSLQVNLFLSVLDISVRYNIHEFVFNIMSVIISPKSFCVSSKSADFTTEAEIGNNSSVGTWKAGTVPYCFIIFLSDVFHLIKVYWCQAIQLLRCCGTQYL